MSQDELYQQWRAYLVRAADVKLPAEDAQDLIAVCDSAYDEGGFEALSAVLAASNGDAVFNGLIEDMAALLTQITGAEVRREEQADKVITDTVEAVGDDILRVGEAAAALGEGAVSAAQGVGDAAKAAGDAAKGSPGAAAVVLGVLGVLAASAAVYGVGKVYRVW